MIKEKCKDVYFDGWESHQCFSNAWKDGYCKHHHPYFVEEKIQKSTAEFWKRWKLMQKRNSHCTDRVPMPYLVNKRLVICNYCDSIDEEIEVIREIGQR